MSKTTIRIREEQNQEAVFRIGDPSSLVQGSETSSHWLVHGTDELEKRYGE
jgi:hypothetical protein